VATSQTYNRAGQKHWNNVIPFRKSAPNQPEQSAEEANSSTVLSPRDEQGPDTERAVEKEEEEEEIPQISLLQAIVLLAVVTVLVAITAEFLVDSINGLTETNPSISKEFISIILLAIVGNAAEHVTAVTGGMVTRAFLRLTRLMQLV
jgi:calcium/proton exchanger cax